jgi:hypothetical protein
MKLLGMFVNPSAGSESPFDKLNFLVPSLSRDSG